MLTITMPLRTVSRSTRFKANETHCPASADVTGALLALNVRSFESTCHYTPLPLHVLDYGRCEVSVGVRAKKYSITDLGPPVVDDPIYNGADIRNRPHLGDRELRK